MISEDGKGITCQLVDALAAADFVNVSVQELGADEYGTQKVVLEDEHHAVKRIAEPESQQHFAIRAEHVAVRIAKRCQVLVGGDGLFQSLGQLATSDNVVSCAHIEEDLSRLRGLCVETDGPVHGVI